MEFFERAAVESTKTDKSFPVRIPSPRNTPAAASVPSPMVEEVMFATMSRFIEY